MRQMLNETYKRKPKGQLNIRFIKKEGKLYRALNTRPSILVNSRDPQNPQSHTECFMRR